MNLELAPAKQANFSPRNHLEVTKGTQKEGNPMPTNGIVIVDQTIKKKETRTEYR